MHHLERLLSAEHSKAQCERIVNYIGSDKDKMGMLMKLFFGGDYRITQRASWPLSRIAELHPAQVRPYFGRLLAQLDKTNLHPAVTRNVVRLLQAIEIPARYQGRVMNKCFELVAAPATAIAVKAFALTVLGNLAMVYPEINEELKVMIEDQWEHATPAYRSRAKKVLKAINKSVLRSPGDDLL